MSYQQGLCGQGPSSSLCSDLPVQAGMCRNSVLRCNGADLYWLCNLTVIFSCQKVLLDTKPSELQLFFFFLSTTCWAGFLWDNVAFHRPFTDVSAVKILASGPEKALKMFQVCCSLPVPLFF